MVWSSVPAHVVSGFLIQAARILTYTHAAYDSNEDDFTFSRKPKKQQTARALNSRDADSQPLRRVDEDKPAPKPRGRKRYSDNLDSDQNETRAPAPPTARRSKRLSGEDAISADVNDQRLTHETRRGRIEERSPNPPPLKTAKTPQPNEEGTLLIDRKRKSTKIALPFNDTPVIQRNKEMRQTSAENRRRSSSTMRGRRASSLIDNGTSTGMIARRTCQRLYGVWTDLTSSCAA